MNIKKTRLLIALAVAIVTATVVSVGLYSFLGPRPAAEKAPAREPTTDIIIARAPIRAGMKLKPEHIKTQTWPRNSLPPGAHTKPEEVLNRAVLSNLVANEPILQNKLALLESGSGLSAVIEEGKRAVTIRVDDVVGVAGFVIPDSHVDVLMTRDIEGKTMTRTILQNMLVLAAGQRVQPDTDRNPIPSQVVTLLATLEESEKLALASADGRLQLVLRNPADAAVGQTSGATLASVLNGDIPRPPVVARSARTPMGGESAKARRRAPAPEVVTPPTKPIYQVEVIKDNMVTVEKFYLE